jgi:aspartate carbamoyltransferase catalytic subunit
MKHQHILSINSLTALDAKQLIERAITLKQRGPTHYPNLSQHSAAALFYENSTRTLMSFSLAAQHCKLPLLAMHMQHSSEKKGETFLDTLLNLHAMDYRLLIIRHPSSDLFAPLLSQLPSDLHLVNAGEGQHEHPSQALLDMMTIMEHFPAVQHLKIAMIGNIRHSRVANSFQRLCALFGIKHLRLIAPKLWQPTQISTGEVTENLSEGIKDADVIITLRVQEERLAEHEHMDRATYHAAYGVTQQTLALANPHAIVMHPGPMNRGIEISSEVADGPQSCILKQVHNGVFIRMSILERLLAT